MKKRYIHPYKAYFPHQSKGLIIGTAPGHRFCFREPLKLLEGDIDFFYGSFQNRFWPVMKKVFEPDSISWLRTKRQCADFLQRHQLAIGDIMAEFYRTGHYAGDENLQILAANRDLIHRLGLNKQIDYAFFTSHESLSLFRKSIHQQLLYIIEAFPDSEMPKVNPKDIFKMKLYDEAGHYYRSITLIVLRSPSPRGVDALALLEDYQAKFALFIQTLRA
ncbi:MAG: hypothetical protein RBR69_02950 [Candidatus Cloacimonadaceae bacterium]|jgi:G:T/U-mismatch repair DNA glycosylase|nr:hypothetical protein [Candidatus Cloacimonadota bacterium]MDY0127075.1 hypothetical protein [Candidatus Cloacimonadaceae bacterium]MCB5254754.1 hypothetical protein [Candidatus Cloacimonadota bacterium]MCK9177881.1 hypothetical protein [Candidatus Cloacimonadota bacterium]MCK9243415.1 hypothetical protein [Candidatus Cloacimonadota bacterium]